MCWYRTIYNNVWCIVFESKQVEIDTNNLEIKYDDHHDAIIDINNIIIITQRIQWNVDNLFNNQIIVECYEVSYTYEITIKMAYAWNNFTATY